MLRMIKQYGQRGLQTQIKRVCYCKYAQSVNVDIR